MAKQFSNNIGKILKKKKRYSVFGDYLEKNNFEFFCGSIIISVQNTNGSVAGGKVRNLKNLKRAPRTMQTDHQ